MTARMSAPNLLLSKRSAAYPRAGSHTAKGRSLEAYHEGANLRLVPRLGGITDAPALLTVGRGDPASTEISTVDSTKLFILAPVVRKCANGTC